MIQGLRISQAPSPRDNTRYRQNYPAQDQSRRSSLYRGIYCYNCREESYYYTSCTRLVVSGAQGEANRGAIDEFQRGHRQYFRGPGPALESPSVPAVPVAAVASGGVEGQEQGGRRMNNIGGANVVILKRPAV